MSLAQDRTKAQVRVNSSRIATLSGQTEGLGGGGGGSVTLDTVGNPAANKNFTMANKQLKFSYTAPATSDGGFEIEATGGFSGDLVHIHQHTGNPGAVDLLHLECDDADVTPIRVSSSGATHKFTGAALDVGTQKITSVVDPTENQHAATKKYVDDNAGGTPTKEFWVHPHLVSATAARVKVGQFLAYDLSSTEECHFQFKVPADFTSITSANVIIIAEGTETIQADIVISAVAAGEDFDANDSSNADQTKVTTASDITEWDISAMFPTTAANDYIGITFASDTTSVDVIGLVFKYA